MSDSDSDCDCYIVSVFTPATASPISDDAWTPGCEEYPTCNFHKRRAARVELNPADPLAGRKLIVKQWMTEFVSDGIREQQRMATQ